MSGSRWDDGWMSWCDCVCVCMFACVYVRAWKRVCGSVRMSRCVVFQRLSIGCSVSKCKYFSSYSVS